VTTQARALLVLISWLGLAAYSPIGRAEAWINVSSGGYGGEDYETSPGEEDSEDEDVVGAVLFASINYESDYIVRLRASNMYGFTSQSAQETALMAGKRLDESGRFYLLAGISRLTDISEAKHSPTVGLPVEALFYPLRGIELSLFGNLNEDSSFVGLGIGFALGKHRAGPRD
jgi:hypothetical protein